MSPRTGLGWSEDGATINISALTGFGACERKMGLWAKRLGNRNQLVTVAGDDLIYVLSHPNMPIMHSKPAVIRCILSVGLVALLPVTARAATMYAEHPGTEGDGHYTIGPDYKIDPDLT